MFHVLLFHLPMPHAARLALLILISAVVYLIGNASVPLWDRDEPRNAQAARQMYQSGDWVVPRYLDKVRTAKPVFTYWCQATAMHLFGDNAFAARLPSVIGVTLTLIVLGVVLTRFVDRDRALWTVLVLGTSGLVIAWSARNSLTDGVLLLWITIAQLCLFAILTGRGSWYVIVTFGISIGLAALTKGHVVLGFLGATLAAWVGSQWWLDRRAQAPFHLIKTITAIAIAAAIVGPWIYLVEQRVPGFLYRATSHELFRRIAEPLEQHYGPPGYYLLFIWGCFFPWSLLLPTTFVIAWRHFRDDPRVRFALAAVIGPWVMLECVQTKLPHYLLPALPPLAYVAADAIVRCLRGEHADLHGRLFRIGVGVWTVIVVALACVPEALTWRYKNMPHASLLVAVVGVGYGVTVLLLFHFRKLHAGLLAMGVGMIVLMAVLHGVYLPRVEPLRLSECIADKLRQHGGGADSTQPGDVQMIGYKEPSLAFYQGGTIREQKENEFLVTHPPHEWPRFLTIREDIWMRMPIDVQEKLEVLGMCHGWAAADGGRMRSVVIVRKR